jgi:hypothetical protein
MRRFRGSRHIVGLTFNFDDLNGGFPQWKWYGRNPEATGVTFCYGPSVSLPPAIRNIAQSHYFQLLIYDCEWPRECFMRGGIDKQEQILEAKLRQVHWVHKESL